MKSIGVSIDYDLKTEAVKDGSDIQEPLLRKVYEVWARARTSGPIGIPRRQDLNLPFSISFALPSITLFDVEEPNRRYLYRVQGTGLDRMIGFNTVGLYLDQVLEGDFYKIIRSLNDSAMDNGATEYSKFFGPWVSIKRYARIAMPIMADDDSRIAQLLIAVDLAFEGGEMVSYQDVIQGNA